MPREASGSPEAVRAPPIFTFVPTQRSTGCTPIHPSPARPGDSSSQDPQQVLANACESLLKLTPDMTIVPNLAVSWENPEPTQWVYQLRPGVTFHGGAEMTAEDVVYSLNRSADYDLGSMVAGAYDVVESIEATGPLEVTVTLKSPDVTFHQEMATTTRAASSARRPRSPRVRTWARQGHCPTARDPSPSRTGPPGRRSSSRSSMATGTPRAARRPTNSSSSSCATQPPA